MCDMYTWKRRNRFRRHKLIFSPEKLLLKDGYDRKGSVETKGKKKKNFGYVSRRAWR
jgi:hypothetical protein